MVKRLRIQITDNDFGFQDYIIKVNNYVIIEENKNKYICDINENKCNIKIYSDNIWTDYYKDNNGLISQTFVFLYFLDVVFGNAIDNLPIYAEYNLNKSLNLEEEENIVLIDSNDILKVTNEGANLWGICAKIQILLICFILLIVVSIGCFVLLKNFFHFAIAFEILSFALVFFYIEILTISAKRF